MIIRVKTTLRQVLDKLPGPVVASMLAQGWLEEYPLELTRRGKQHIQLVFLRRSIRGRFSPQVQRRVE